MNKKITGFLLAASVFVSAQVTNFQFNQALADSVSVDSLVDITPNHWAYDAVKLMTQELGIMSPKTSTRFMGTDITTRYEVAEALYNMAKKLEASSGKDLKVTGDKRTVSLTDVDASKKDLVNSVINEYGLMQAMPGNKFMGNEKMSRYELAFELNNYINLLIKKVGKVSLDSSDKANSFTDIKEEHWATPSVRSIVNNGCQLMSGYPDSTFKGFQSLSRYEMAAVLRKFVVCVDKYLIPVVSETPAPVETPMPTVAPTVEPSPEPTPEVTPEPVATKKPLSTTDLKLGGMYKVSSLDTATNKLGTLYGPSAQVDFRFGAFQIGLNGEYLMYAQDFNNVTKVASLGRAVAGGDLGWRIFGTESDEDASLYVGVGGEYLQWFGSAYTYPNYGPRGRVALEIPLGSWFSIFAEDTYTYYPISNTSFINNPTWKNDLFAGITIPAYTGFSIQLGYKDTRYELKDSPNKVFGDVGGLANLRFRF